MTYTRKFKTARVNFGLVDLFKRLIRQQWWFDAEASQGEVKVEMYKGDRNTKETKSHSFSITGSAVDTIKKNITWDKTDINFQFELTSTGHVALLGFLNYFIPKRRNK